MFSEYVVLGKDNARFRGGEPSLHIDKEGTLWTTNIGPGQIWKSVDGGKSWIHIPPPIDIGGADMDAAKDGVGRLHVADQAGLDCIFYYRSLDGGHSFDIVRGTHGKGIWFDGKGDCAVKYDVANPVDKPWIATWGNGTVCIVYGESGRSGVDCSYDGGRSFAHSVAPVAAHGVAVDPIDGSLYLVYQTGGAFDLVRGAQVEHVVGVSASHDGGKTFTDTVVIDRRPFDVLAGNFASIAVDQGQNVYVTWSDDSSGRVEIYMSVSGDKGKSWSLPKRVSSTQTVSIHPTIVAGDAGKVAVAWYGTPDLAKTRYNAPNTNWFVYVAVSTNALEETSTFEEVEVHPEPFHRNSICAHVNLCEGVDITTGQRPTKYEGGIADFFRIALDNEGLINVIWTDTAHYNDSPKDHFAKQTSGVRLLNTR